MGGVVVMLLGWFVGVVVDYDDFCDAVACVVAGMMGRIDESSRVWLGGFGERSGAFFHVRHAKQRTCAH